MAQGSQYGPFPDRRRARSQHMSWRKDDLVSELDWHMDKCCQLNKALDSVKGDLNSARFDDFDMSMFRLRGLWATGKQQSNQTKGEGVAEQASALLHQLPCSRMCSETSMYVYT